MMRNAGSVLGKLGLRHGVATGALGALLLVGTAATGHAAPGAPATAWSQGSLTPPAGQSRMTAPGGRRGKAARRGYRMKRHR